MRERKRTYSGDFSGSTMTVYSQEAVPASQLGIQDPKEMDRCLRDVVWFAYSS